VPNASLTGWVAAFTMAPNPFGDAFIWTARSAQRQMFLLSAQNRYDALSTHMFSRCQMCKLRVWNIPLHALTCFRLAVASRCIREARIMPSTRIILALTETPQCSHPCPMRQKKPVHTATQIRFAPSDVVSVPYGQCSLRLAVHPTSSYEANNRHKGFR
jgi:hypothetical protein